MFLHFFLKFAFSALSEFIVNKVYLNDAQLLFKLFHLSNGTQLKQVESLVPGGVTCTLGAYDRGDTPTRESRAAPTTVHAVKYNVYMYVYVLFSTVYAYVVYHNITCIIAYMS